MPCALPRCLLAERCWDPVRYVRQEFGDATAYPDNGDPGTMERPPVARVRMRTLITTAPNRLMAHLHDCMPVIVPRNTYDRWLGPGLLPDDTRALLAPYAPEAMRAYPVAQYVNDPRNNDPAVLAQLSDEASYGGAPPDGAPSRIA